ncbi:hypothetical protein CONCODRAFT_2010 [Conidiobolus coronatus NRRL 28638]|uniref:Secreted protein n=1 Tax=Conidiobolus coronatus (strain ATCC 28846 / CBS 209.66 / NRRL 28638) TaxID=796925 RepID=A0A137PIY0_CONC2|nr:hypothetical protein CONCODRAFT_2010 [Conidiobolus coronatus NRRL 28638]|eukprot:KXN74935.1 hypothetical protein CONCODRAFT_2010 [Conidiobolus coronatus NRRL 28638]
MKLIFNLISLSSSISAKYVNCDDKIPIIQHYGSLNIGGRVISDGVWSNVCEYSGCAKRLDSPYTDYTGDKCLPGSSVPIDKGYMKNHYCNNIMAYNDLNKLLEEKGWRYIP